MAKNRKERCPECDFWEVIKWGVQAGHQRYKCKNCGSVFTFRMKDVAKSNRFVWFNWWILGKQTLEQISDLSGYSTCQLSRWFDEYLGSPPPIFFLPVTNYFWQHYQKNRDVSGNVSTKV